MADFYIKRNDTSPGLEYTLSPATVLTGATVRFHMFASNGVEKVDAAATIEDAVNGIVRYGWVAADVDTLGTFNAEFEVTFADGTITTYPNTKHLVILITPDLK